jgi:hypothetical protein
MIVLRDMVEDLIEHQRVSRFDTILFLLYPVLLAGMIALTSAILQYRALQGISILGIDFVVILVLGGLLIIAVLGLGFVAFILAYLRDDLKARIGACVYIIDMFGLLIIMFLLACAVPGFQIFEGIVKPDSLRHGLQGGLAFGVGYTMSAVWAAPTSLSRQRIASWFEGAAPRMFVAAQRPFINNGEWKKKFLDVKIGSLMTCCVYGAMVISLIRAYGFQGTAIYHAAVLIVLVALTCFLILYRSLRAMIRSSMA